MKIVETTFERLPRERLVIGFEGENLRATVRIDCSSVFAEYPNATPTLIVKPLFADAYPVVVDRNGTDVDWLITSEILSFTGDGEIQLVFYKGEVICKSAITKIRVCRSLTVTGDMPDPVVQWIENANRKLAEVDAQIVELEGMVDTATDAATRAHQSEGNATTAAANAATSAETARTKAAEAQASANTATAKASEAALSATQARNSAMSAANSESGATAKAAEAAQSAQTAAQKAEEITEAAQIATGKAEEASASATAAQASATNAASSATAAQAAQTAAKASETAASTSATQAAQSAQSANTAAQTAEQKATEASQSATSAATSAETATTKAEEAAASAQAAQDAKTAVEQTAEQLAESLEQISQNTADIAEHEQEYNALKEATLIHNTASGAIASFPDGAEMPVDDVTVQINPVQDLHGYDHPWPAGGGKNLFYYEGNTSATVNGLTATFDGDTQTISITGTNTGTSAYVLLSIPCTGDIPRETPLARAILNAPSGTYINFVYRKNRTWYAVNNGGVIPTDIDENTAINVQLGIYSSATTINVTGLHVQIERGTTAPTEWTPYANVCPITGHTGVNVTRTGKNLYSRENGEYNVPVYAVDGSAGVYPDVNAVWLKVKPNTTYHVSFVKPTQMFYFRWINCDKNKGFISRPGNTYSSNKVAIPDFTTTAETEWVEIAVNQYDTNYLSQNDWLICISETATDYEPYQGETYDIAFPSEAGTVYGGSLSIAEDGSGVLTVDRASAVLSNSNLYGYNGTRNSNLLLALAVSGKKPGEYNFNSDRFSLQTSAPDKYTMHGRAATTTVEFEIPFSALGLSGNEPSATMLAAGKTWMEENHPQLVYELDTPETYDLTASQITTLLGENNLWHDANGDISVVYKANTKLYIDNKIAELVARIVNS